MFTRIVQYCFLLFLFAAGFNPCLAFSTNKTCNSCCGKLSESQCPVKKGCIRIPERTQQFFIGLPDCEFQEETVPAADIYFRKQGKSSDDRPTIVFIHGLGETSDAWLCAQEELCDCYCTVAMDLRGFGRSDKTPAAPQRGGIHYTLQLNVDDIFELLRKLGIKKNIVLVAHSLGANNAIKYVSLHQDQIIKLVLVGAYPFIVPDCAVTANCATSCTNPFTCEPGFCYPFGITQTFAAAITQPLVDCLNAGGSQKACLKVWGQFLAPIWYNEPCQKKLKNAQASLVKAIQSMTVPILNSIFFNGLTEDIRPLLPGITVPTLICYGSADLAVNPGNSLFLHANLVNSVIADFVGKGHQLHVTDYKNFNRLLREFITACQFPDSIKVINPHCCVCPLVKPVNYAKQACSRDN